MTPVDAEVKQGTATELGIVHAVLRVGRGRLVVVGNDRAHLSDGAGRDDLAHAHHVREPPCPHRLEHDEILRGGQVDDGLSLDGIDRERFLHQYVLAAVQRGHRVCGMERMRRRDIDRVDVRGGGQSLVARVGASDPVRCRERIRGVLRARPHGSDASTRGENVGREGLCDAARAQNSPANPISHVRPSSAAGVDHRISNGSR